MGLQTNPYTVVVTIKVVDTDGETVDHRGLTPRKGAGAQTCEIRLPSQMTILEANKLMNAVYGMVSVVHDIRDIS